jgi:sugar phosphate isomerase/epimerase
MKYGARFDLNEHTSKSANEAGLGFVEYPLNEKFDDERAQELTKYGKELYRHDIELATVAPPWWDLGKKDEQQFKETVPDFRRRLTLSTRMATKLMILEVDNTEGNFKVESFKSMLNQVHQHSSNYLQVAVRFRWRDRNAQIFRFINGMDTAKFMFSVDPVDFVTSDASYKPEEIRDLMNRTIHMNYDPEEWDDVEGEKLETIKKYIGRRGLYVTGEATTVQSAQEEQEEVNELATTGAV